jgi:hypothetical protein
MKQAAYLLQACTNIAKKAIEPSQNSRRQKGENSKIPTEDAHILGVTVPNLIATAIWCPGLCTPALLFGSNYSLNCIYTDFIFQVAH